LYAEWSGRELFFAGKKSGLVRKVDGTFAVEVLRASPVKVTGVHTPDLVGCPQNDISMTREAVLAAGAGFGGGFAGEGGVERAAN